MFVLDFKSYLYTANIYFTINIQHFSVVHSLDAWVLKVNIYIS